MDNKVIAEMLLCGTWRKAPVIKAIREAARGDTTTLVNLLESDWPLSKRDRTQLAKYIAGDFKRGRGRPRLNAERPRTERDRIARAKKKAAATVRAIKRHPDVQALLSEEQKAVKKEKAKATALWDPVHGAKAAKPATSRRELHDKAVKVVADVSGLTEAQIRSALKQGHQNSRKK